MADSVTADIGDEAENLTVGKGNTQNAQRNTQRANPRQYQSAGDSQQNVTFGNSDNQQLWWKLMEMAAQIRELAAKLDDLPNRVGRLEKVEVVVQPAPVAVIPPPPDSLNLSMRAILTIFGVALLAVVALVGFLIYLQVG